MPIMTKREFPASVAQPEMVYEFELDEKETELFFNELLKDFFDPSQLGDLEVREKKVTFSMKMFKKENTEDIGIE